MKFNVLNITETRFKFNSMPIGTFELEGYVIEHTPTESSFLRWSSIYCQPY